MVKHNKIDIELTDDELLDIMKGKDRKYLYYDDVEVTIKVKKKDTEPIEGQ